MDGNIFSWSVGRKGTFITAKKLKEILHRVSSTPWWIEESKIILDDRPNEPNTKKKRKGRRKKN